MRERIFVSYSHQDRKHLDRLLVHLRPLERSGIIDLWSDIQLRPGSKWKSEIAEAIARSKVAILLISADFLASQFITENELPPLLRAAKSDGVVILPVIVGASRFTKTAELSIFQSVNDPAKPLAVLPVAERERIWVRVADSVEATLLNRSSEDAWIVVNEKKIRENLNELVNSTGGWLIVSSGDHYVQFTVGKGSLVMEAVSNQYLPAKLQLVEAKDQLLHKLGFNGPDKAFANYFRVLPLKEATKNVDSLAGQTVRAMADVYEVSRAAKLAVELTLLSDSSASVSKH
jgi:T3SS (YopN, CesT) and YbjN peptide-binding chaperone 3/TIR domain